MYLAWHLYDKGYLWFGLNNYTVRPVAHFLDIFVWSNFYNNTFALLCIMTLFCLVLVFILGRLFEKAGYNVKFELALLLLLLPVGCEATYWIAAATRIIVGIFFAAASYEFLFNKTKLKLPLFIIFNLLSFFFYEQVSVVSLFLGLILIVKAKLNRWYLTVPIINSVIFILYYYFFSNVRMAGQDRDMLPVSELLPHAAAVAENIASSFINGCILIYSSFIRGYIFLFGSAAGMIVFTVIFVS